MINAFKYMTSRRRVSLTIWVLNIILCLVGLAFALR